MQAEPVAAALRSLPVPGRMLSMAPNGQAASQSLMRELAHEENITILCGRYEGFDARLYEMFPLQPVGVGDIVLNGGETAALAIMEAVARLVPGFMGKEASGEEESFSRGLLEYPHFTRPPELEGCAIPKILAGGDHGAIAAWRRREALATTLARRPQMLDDAPLTREDARVLSELPRLGVARSVSFCLTHYPVLLDGHRIGTASLTSLDLHDIARVSCTYGFGPFYVATPLDDQRALCETMLRHWERAGQRGHGDRLRALNLVRTVGSVEEALANLESESGQQPMLVATSANWPKKGRVITCGELRVEASRNPILLLLGTSHGLSPEIVCRCDAVLRPVRFAGYNHLSVRSAAAILADRIAGDFM